MTVRPRGDATTLPVTEVFEEDPNNVRDQRPDAVQAGCRYSTGNA